MSTNATVAQRDRLPPKTLNVAPDGRSFFSGAPAVQRMTEIRRLIEKVRDEWPRTTEVPAYVRRFLDDVQTQFPGVSDLLDTVTVSFARNRHWADRQPSSAASVNYDLIRLYTRDDAYKALFAAVNQRYRRDDALANVDTFTAMTWLVELLTMELFALSLENKASPAAREVFRGMHFPRKMLPQYQRFADPGAHLDERAVSIPLGFMSTSRSRPRAERFYATSLTEGHADLVNVMWRIKIVTLSPAQLHLYRRRYPSVVTRICATDISAKSNFEPEEEVLLRGPFFDVVDWRPTAAHDGVETCEVDAVMVDNNRDHISTRELDKDDPAARELFGNLVVWRRSAECADLADKLKKPELAAQYRARATEAAQRVTRK